MASRPVEDGFSRDPGNEIGLGVVRAESAGGLGRGDTPICVVAPQSRTRAMGPGAPRRPACVGLYQPDIRPWRPPGIHRHPGRGRSRRVRARRSCGLPAALQASLADADPASSAARSAFLLRRKFISSYFSRRWVLRSQLLVVDEPRESGRDSASRARARRTVLSTLRGPAAFILRSASPPSRKLQAHRHHDGEILALPRGCDLHWSQLVGEGNMYFFGIKSPEGIQ